jgi:hypothetical protein
MSDSSVLATAGKAFSNLQTMFGVGSSQYPLVTVKSTVDGQPYRVRDMPDKQQAADLLAKVREILPFSWFLACPTIEAL